MDADVRLLEQQPGPVQPVFAEIFKHGRAELALEAAIEPRMGQPGNFREFIQARRIIQILDQQQPHPLQPLKLAGIGALRRERVLLADPRQGLRLQLQILAFQK